MKQSDALVKAYQVPGTPALIVAGKYRIDNTMLSGPGEFVDLVKYLVQKGSAGR